MIINELKINPAKFLQDFGRCRYLVSISLFATRWKKTIDPSQREKTRGLAVDWLLSQTARYRWRFFGSETKENPNQGLPHDFWTVGYFQKGPSNLFIKSLLFTSFFLHDLSHSFSNLGRPGHRVGVQVVCHDTGDAPRASGQLLPAKDQGTKHQRSRQKPNAKRYQHHTTFSSKRQKQRKTHKVKTKGKILSPRSHLTATQKNFLQEPSVEAICLSIANQAQPSWARANFRETRPMKKPLLGC